MTNTSSPDLLHTGYHINIIERKDYHRAIGRNAQWLYPESIGEGGGLAKIPERFVDSNNPLSSLMI